MPLVSASDQRVQEIRRLQQEAAYHKREMYRHKEELRRTKTELAQLEESVTQPQHGEGVIHGHQHTRS